MAFLSSKTLIQLHALFTFIIAVYLIVSPNSITDSNIIFIIGEAMQIDVDPATAATRMPLAICGLLLTSGALVDLIIVRILPQVDDILHNSQQDQRRTTEDTGFTRLTLQKPRQPINASTVQLAALYNEVWTFIAGLRFCFFFVVSLYIYTGRSSVSSNGSSATSGWEGADTLAWSSSSGDAGVVKSGLDQIRSRVVFTYTFVEMMFWLWTLSNVREERREVAVRLSQQQAAENEKVSK